MPNLTRQRDCAHHAGGADRLDTRAWLAAFARTHGRPLRVLHIGNIANNAYRNAAIQRQQGIEADVVCYDYYHVMSTPEWEDAGITGSYDAFLPDWWQLDAGGTPRPSWFVQGPLRLCLDYLRARQRRDVAAQKTARLGLIRAYADMLRNKTLSRNITPDVLSPSMRAATLRLAPELAGYREAPPPPPSRQIAAKFQHLLDRYAAAAWQRSLTDQTVSGLLDGALTRRSEGAPLSTADEARLTAYIVLKTLTGRDGQADRIPAPPGYWGRAHDQRSAGYLLSRYAAGSALALTLRSVAAVRDWLWPRLGAEPHTPAPAASDTRHTSGIEDQYRRDNSELPAAEIEADIAAARAMADLWRDLLPYYDVVQGYAFDASIPLFCRHPTFTAYEHGTVRLIPFEETRRGRLCRFTYKHTPRVFITNSDVLPSADRIPIVHDRRIHLPHAFDDAKLKRFRYTHASAPKPATPVCFFSPTRHHWKSGDTSWLKGNDIFLRAAARVAAEGASLKIELIDWGQEVSDSKALIEELGLSHLVSWAPIMNRAQLWAAYLKAHVVVDQFALPALGGVGYESMTLGCRLMTRIDVATLAAFFGATPPLLNAATVDEAAGRIREVIADPDDRAGLGARAQTWAATYHSTQRILDLQIAAYRDMMQSSDHAAGPAA